MTAELGALDNTDDVVRAFLDYSAPRDEQERGFIMALITAIRSDHAGPTSTADSDDYQIAALFADIFAAWEAPIRAAVDDQVTAEIILQVGNGMYLAAVCGLPAPDPALLQQVIDRLLASAHRE
ncbi:MAG: hypothetical protein M3Y77_00480 [Actinomycetota bacterium]|nr:hypothetical protein [Actinomycetota bacterium]